MRAALSVTLCTASRATRPVAGRSGGTPWARRPARRYERRRPDKTPLHKIVSEHLESLLEWGAMAERPVPGYVEDKLRGYLECGILCFRAARAVCMTRRTGLVVASSCKGRGVCPSSNGRNMARDGRPSCRSGDFIGVCAAVGDLRAEAEALTLAAAALSRRPTPSRCHPHEDLS